MLDLSPPNNPINARELSLAPRLSLFSEVSYSNSPYEILCESKPYPVSSLLK